jgi:hypothetical protein
VPRRDQDRDLGNFRREHRVETQEAAEPGSVSRHLRAVEPGHHRRRWFAALARNRFIVGLFLVLVHFVGRKQLQAHVVLWF